MRTLPHGIVLPKKLDPSNALRIDMACLPACCSMEENGMAINVGYLQSLYTQMTGEMEELSRQFGKMVGREINIGSGDQLSTLLFDDLKLKQPGKQKWTKSKARLSVDSDVLKGMIAQHSCIKLALDWCERKKLVSTYTLSLAAQVDSNSRLHPEIIHTGPETGRLACKNPNLYNLPVRSKLGKMIRRAFVASKGNVLGVVDASQIEIRVNAYDSQCKNLLECYRSGGDVYWDIAEKMYRRKFTEEDRKHGVDPVTGLTLKEYCRFNAKTTTLGTVYDISPEGLLDQFLVFDAITFLTGGKSKVWDYDTYYESALELCKRAILDFYEGYPEVLLRRGEHHRRAKQFGFCWEDFGRPRWIPQVRSTFSWIVREGLRAAGNHPIQGMSAGIFKLWLACVYDRVREYWGRFGIRLTNSVYDEIDCEGPEEVVKDFLQESGNILTELMPEDLFNCPLGFSSAIGENWAECEK